MSTAVATLRAGGGALLPIYPQTFEEVVRFARLSIMAGMIKPQTKGYGDNAVEEDQTAVEARATMIIMQGMELGIPPMQAVQLLAMINGRITAHSEAVPGLLLSRGFKIAKSWRGTEMVDDWTSVCTLTRPDGQKFIGEYSVIAAKRARLWSPSQKITKKGKGGSSYEADNDSPWHRYPDRMLWARALGFAAKDGAADALKGLMVREEMEDIIRSEMARDITPAKAAPLAIPDDVTDTGQTSGLSPESGAPQASDAARKTSSAEAAEKPAELEMLADPEGFLAKLADDLALCSTNDERAEVADACADLMERLPPDHRSRAEKMISEAGG